MIPEATCGKVSAQRRVSLWLLPPEPLRCELQTQINRISARSDGLCPPFLPHITILGGVPCSDKTEADEILSRLRSCLDIGYFDGGVPCCFGHNEVISFRTQNGAVKWNQSCACEYEYSKSKNSTGRSHTCYLWSIEFISDFYS